jgi:hypothetical protein
LQPANEVRAPRLMAGSAEGEPYQTDAARQSPQEAQRVTPGPRTDAQRHTAAQAAQGPDAYAEGETTETADEARDGDDPTLSAPARQPAATSSAKHTGPAAFIMPFTKGGTAIVGTALGDVTSADLKKAMGWAMANATHEDFIEAASQLLDDRTHGEASEPVAPKAAR